MKKYTNILQAYWKKNIVQVSLVLAVLCAIFLYIFTVNGFQAELFGSGSTAPVFEGEGISGGAKLVQTEIEGSNLGIAETGSLMDSIIFVIKYLLIFSGIIALIAFLYAGFRYITSMGGEVDVAKDAMINAAIGIVIILFSWVIINFLITFDL